MFKLLGGIFAAGCLLSGQTTVGLRASRPAGFQVTGAAPDGGSIQIQTREAHQLQADDLVGLYNVCGTTNANGKFAVASVADATHFTLKTLGGAPVPFNAPWCSGGKGGWAGGSQYGGKIALFSLAGGPKGGLDGWNGKLTRALAVGTHNGLATLTVSGGAPQLVYSFNPELKAGDQVGIWGTASAALNNGGAAYTVAAVATSGGQTTVTLSPTAAAAGDYTFNNSCGPSGADNCVRVSERAHTGNPFWTALVNASNQAAAPESYQGHVFESKLVAGALRFFVDQQYTPGKTGGLWILNHAERINGVGFNASEIATHGGDPSFGDFSSYIFRDIAVIYSVLRDYLSPRDKQTFLNKMLADLPEGCVKRTTDPVASQTGTAQGATATSIQLAASDAQPSGYYVNQSITITAGTGAGASGKITAYDAATKIATVAVSWSAMPGAGSQYAIYPTAIIDSTSTKVTGFGTRFTTQFSAGDGIGGWYVSSPPAYTYWVQSIESDTSMTVTPSGYRSLSTVDPTPVLTYSQWKPGDCGAIWLKKHWQGSTGAHPSLYPPNGGSGAYPVLGGGANNVYTEAMGLIAFGLAAADDDPRAQALLEQAENYWFDHLAAYSLEYVTGFAQSGSYYSWIRTMLEGPTAAQFLAGAVEGFPSLDTDGPWFYGQMLNRIYGAYPDSGGTAKMSRWGAQTGDTSVYPYSDSGASVMSQPFFTLHPDAPVTRYFRNWQESRGMWSPSWLHPIWVHRQFLEMDPNAGSDDYRTLPTQYLFQANSPICASLTGRPCDRMRADAVVSRTGWSSASDTHVLYQSRSFLGDHDVWSAGSLRLQKAAPLLNSDTTPAGAGQEAQTIPQWQDTLPEIGGNNYRYGAYAAVDPTSAPLTRWAGAQNANRAYGDAQSRYVYAMTDFAQSFTAAPNLAQRHFIHLKKAGTEEIVAQIDKIDVSNAPSTVTVHIHYPQNGETNQEFPEGNTTCPGPSGCAGLDNDRSILSTEDGAGGRVYGVASRFLSPGAIFMQDDGAYQGGAGHTHRVSICGGTGCGRTVSTFEGLTLHRVGPSAGLSLTTTERLKDGAHYVVQADDKIIGMGRGAGLVDGYPAHAVGAGVTQAIYTDLRAGAYAATVDGAPAASCSVVTGDNTCYLESLPPGMLTLSRTAGASLQVTGASAAFVWRAGDDVPDAIPFPVACAPACGALTAAPSAGWITARWNQTTTPAALQIAVDPTGLAAGDYSASVAISSPDASGAPVNIAVTLTVQDAFRVTTNALPTGAAGAPYSQTVAASGGAAPYTWSIVGGQLPDGLELTPAGVIQGRPKGQGSTFFVVQCAAADRQTTVRRLGLTVYGGRTAIQLRGVGIRGARLQ